MSALLHSLVISLAIIGAFIWIKTPGLSVYSLQAFFLAILLYFAYKRITRATFWHIAPRSASWEISLVTFALLLLIGSTGNLDSWMYPLTYLHLFFLVLACELSTVLFATALIMLFHFALTPGMSLVHIPHLLTLPLVLLCFLFTKEQYNQLNDNRVRLNQQTGALMALENQGATWQQLVNTFLLPKLDMLQKMIRNPQENRSALEGQIALIKLELTKHMVANKEKAARVQTIPSPDET